MRTLRIASVLGCLSIGAYASLGACTSSSGTNGSGDRGASSGGSRSVADSGSSSSGGGGVDGSSSGGSSGVGSSSGGASSSGSASDGSSGSDSGGSKPYSGVIGAIMGSAAGQSSWSGAAAFAATPDAGEASTCQGTQSGSCCYMAPGSSAGNTPTYVSAGDLVVKDGSNTIATMSPGTQNGAINVYGTSSQQGSTFKWAGGDTLSFTAAGGTVDAFSGTVVAPGLMQNIDPALGTTMPTMIPIGSDFTVSWTPGGTSGVGCSIYLSATKSSTPDGSITCTGMDSAGTLTVPQALLAKMTTGDTLQIVLTRITSSLVTTGNANVVIGVAAETLAAGQLQ